jgi:ADP-heptose:LPS heptosyltransferase
MTDEEMPQKKLLIIHQGALGDFIATFPAIILLRNRFNPIDAYCQGKLSKLAQTLRMIDNGFPIEAPHFSSLYSGAVHAEVKRILKTYDHIILFSFSTQLEQSIKTIIRNNVHRIPPRPDGSRRIHVGEYLLGQLKSCGLIKTPGCINGRVLASIGHPDRRDKSFDPKKIVLHPGSGSRRKNWPIQNFIKVGSALRSNSFVPEFILGPAEIDLIEELEKEEILTGHIHVVDDLTELAGRLKTSGGFIGNDSGVCHLAAFLGLPTVTVFGPSDPQRWKPVGRAVKAVWAEPDCGPCFETEKRDGCEMECLKKITPKMVINAFFELI